MSFSSPLSSSPEESTLSLQHNEKLELKKPGMSQYWWILIVLVVLLGTAGWFVFRFIPTTILNPTEKPLEVTIDGAVHTVEPGTTTKVNIFPGTHIVFFNGKTETFEKPWINMNFLSGPVASVLNPTHTFYVAETIKYATPGQEIRVSSFINIDGNYYEDKYDGVFLYEFTDLYTIVHYLPGEESPNEVSLDTSAKSETRYKLSTKKEFIEKYAIPVDETEAQVPVTENQKFSSAMWY